MKARLVTVSVTLALSFVAFTVPANAAPSWSSPTILATPTNFTGVNAGIFAALSCSSSSYCLVAATDTDGAGGQLPVAYAWSSGSWQVAVALPDPAGNWSGNPGGSSCIVVSTKNVCAVVGNYTNPNNTTGALLDFVTNGTAKSSTVTLPSNQSVSSPYASFRAVTCVAAATPTCVAVGTYMATITSANRLLPFVVTATYNGSAWVTSAAQLAVPSDANRNPSTALAQVTCPSTSECVAAGTYVTRNGEIRGLVETEHSGTWAGTALVAPSDASRYATLTPTEVTCASVGNCVVIGTYGTRFRAVQPFVAGLVNGTWQTATTLTLPAGASSNPRVLFFGFAGISCPSAGNCALGGQYRDANGNAQGFLANEVNGTWHQATTLPLPDTARYGGRNGGVVSVSCSAAAGCTAAGSYVDAAGNYATGTVSESAADVWSTIAPLTFPINPGPWTNVNLGGGIYAINCFGANNCVAVGSVWDGTNYQGFAVNA
jgi:hypothetical protein